MQTVSKNITVNTKNMLPIIKKWLYSQQDVFVRELVSNASDAIEKLQYLLSVGEASVSVDEFKIQIYLDKTMKTITFSDNGIGLNAEELEQYIGQVAFSGAQDFIQKYEKLGDQADRLIGFFGLGFYSAFMVASRVQIHSLSYREGSTPVIWESDGVESYTISEGSRSSVGTDIILFLEEEAMHFLEQNQMKSVLEKYTRFIENPIFLDGEKIDMKKALWKESPQNITDKDYEDFYKTISQRWEKPIFWIHLNTDFPFHIRGILFFPKLSHELQALESHIKIFVKNVFVGDNIKEIVPDFLSPLVGVLESQDIPLNVSRSQIQFDPKIAKIKTHIQTKIADKLAEIDKKDHQEFEAIWKEIHLFLKFGCIQDEEFFKKIQHLILFETNHKKWISLDNYLKEFEAVIPKNSDGKKSIILYSDQPVHDLDQNYLPDPSLPIILLNPNLDSHFIQFLERKLDHIEFAKINSEANPAFQDSVSTYSPEELEKTKEAIIKLIPTTDPLLKIEVKEIKNKSIHALFMTQEQEDRMEKMLSMMQKDSAGLPKMRNLYFNALSPLVQKALLLSESQPEKATTLLEYIIDLTYLQHGDIPTEKKAHFLEKSYQLLENL